MILLERASILVVDDEEVNRLVAVRMLRRLGCCAVMCAANGAEAVVACRGQRFDVIIMDCHMPVMDGLAATTAIRGMGVGTPILAYTATAIPGQAQACLDAGMDDFVVKPASLQVLAERLQYWLARQPGPP